MALKNLMLGGLCLGLVGCASMPKGGGREPAVSGITQKCEMGDTPQYPNPSITPGAVRQETTMKDVCTPGFTAGERSSGPAAVTEREKMNVFMKYFGAIPANPGDYEVDHLISLQLGGSNDIRNLWPQSYCPFPGAKEKDVVESKLHDWICAGNISMEDAQKIITTDWYACYKTIKSGGMCEASGAAHHVIVSDGELLKEYVQ